MVAGAGILAARGGSIGIDARRGLVDRRAADVGWIVCPESAEIHRVMAGRGKGRRAGGVVENRGALHLQQLCRSFRRLSAWQSRALAVVVKCMARPAIR